MYEYTRNTRMLYESKIHRIVYFFQNFNVWSMEYGVRTDLKKVNFEAI